MLVLLIMTLSVQSVNPKTEKRILSWGGGGAIASALALYYFKGDSALLKWISLALGVGGLAALGYGVSDESKNSNVSSSPLITSTNVSKPAVDIKTFLEELERVRVRKRTDLISNMWGTFGAITSTEFLSGDNSLNYECAVEKFFRKDSITEEHLGTCIKDEKILLDLRLAAGKELINRGKYKELVIVLKEMGYTGNNQLIVDNLLEELNDFVDASVIEELTKKTDITSDKGNISESSVPQASSSVSLKDPIVFSPLESFLISRDCAREFR